MDFFTLLVRFETTLWDRVDRALRADGHASTATLLALRVLNRHGDSGRVHELSDELAITIGAASKLVDRLERDGFAQRRPHPRDRRSSLISLTAQGEQALADGLAAADRILAGLLPDDAEVAAAAEALGRLETRLAARTDAIAR